MIARSKGKKCFIYIKIKDRDETIYSQGKNEVLIENKCIQKANNLPLRVKVELLCSVFLRMEQENLKLTPWKSPLMVGYQSHVV
mgnify:CR=1 FL=1